MDSRSKDSTDEKKKQTPIAKMGISIFKILFFVELAKELKLINKRLETVLTIVGDMEGKLKKKNPFKEQILRNKIILVLIYLIPVFIIIFMYQNFPAPVMLEYVKMIFSRLVECIKVSKFNFDYILAKDLMAYYVARTWLVLVILQIVTCVAVSKLIIRYHYMIYMTKKFKIEALGGGFIKESGPCEILMTPAGLMINLESNTEKGFVESDNIWNQLNVYPGKVYNAKNQRTLIFVSVVQPMKDSYKYFENNSIEVKK